MAQLIIVSERRCDRCQRILIICSRSMLRSLDSVGENGGMDRRADVALPWKGPGGFGHYNLEQVRVIAVYF